MRQRSRGKCLLLFVVLLWPSLSLLSFSLLFLCFFSFRTVAVPPFLACCNGILRRFVKGGL